MGRQRRTLRLSQQPVNHPPSIRSNLDWLVAAAAQEIHLKARETFWDGPDTHPLVAGLDARLAAGGFRFSGYHADRGASAALWRKPAFAGCEHEISVESNTRERGFVNAKVHLCVVSTPHHAVEQALALEECDRNSGFAEPPESSPPLIIASVGLNWLAQRWPPKDRDAWQRWSRISRDEAAATAEHLHGFIATQGMACFERLGDAHAYAACALDPITHFPAHRAKDPGLICARPYEYAAVALRLAGDRDQALRVIEAYRAQIGQPGAGIYRVTPQRSACERCRADRLQAWIQT
jgi:hypothetical protein